MRLLLTLIFSGTFLGMLWATVTASFDRDVFTAAAEIWADPWGRATLFDAYFGFISVYVWVAYRETSWISRVIWFVLFMALGNFAIAAYVLIALWRLPADAPMKDLLLRPADRTSASA
ncbi:MAG: DUF1475 family protein [Acidobacteriota bacterium]